jgi:hypothetical protein
MVLCVCALLIVGITYMFICFRCLRLWLSFYIHSRSSDVLTNHTNQTSTTNVLKLGSWAHGCRDFFFNLFLFRLVFALFLRCDLWFLYIFVDVCRFCSLEFFTTQLQRPKPKRKKKKKPQHTCQTHCKNSSKFKSLSNHGPRNQVKKVVFWDLVFLGVRAKG